MITEWNHLPNADYIDRIIVSLQQNLKNWPRIPDNQNRMDCVFAARNSMDNEKNSLWYSISDVLWAAIDSGRQRRDERWPLRGPTNWLGQANYANWDTARIAILALIVWDDCAHLLDAKPPRVKLLASLGSQPAALLYPVCLALNVIDNPIMQHNAQLSYHSES